MRLGHTESFLKTKVACHNWNYFTCSGHGFLQLEDLRVPEMNRVRTKLVQLVSHHWEGAGLLDWAQIH